MLWSLEAARLAVKNIASLWNMAGSSAVDVPVKFSEGILKLPPCICWPRYEKRTITSVHYGDVIMGAIASQITSLTIVYSTAWSDADQRKHQSSASLAFVWGIQRGPVNSPPKWPVTRKMFPFDDVIMVLLGCMYTSLNNKVLSGCPGYVLSCVWIVLGTSCLGYELSHWYSMNWRYTHNETRHRKTMCHLNDFAAPQWCLRTMKLSAQHIRCNWIAI